MNIDSTLLWDGIECLTMTELENMLYSCIGRLTQHRATHRDAQNYYNRILVIREKRRKLD